MCYKLLYTSCPAIDYATCSLLTSLIFDVHYNKHIFNITFNVSLTSSSSNYLHDAKLLWTSFVQFHFSFLTIPYSLLVDFLLHNTSNGLLPCPKYVVALTLVMMYMGELYFINGKNILLHLIDERTLLNLLPCTRYVVSISR